MNKKINKHLLQIVAVLVVTGFCTAAYAQVVVSFEVSGDKLIPTTRGACAKQPNPPGCIRVAGRTNINFNLPGNNPCSGGPGARWELDHVSLSNSDGGAPGGLSAAAASDFGANQSSGRVTAINQSPTHIMIRDNDSAAYDVWYTVYARCVGGTGMIDSDPRIENTGIGN